MGAPKTQKDTQRQNRRLHRVCDANKIIGELSQHRQRLIITAKKRGSLPKRQTHCCSEITHELVYFYGWIQKHFRSRLLSFGSLAKESREDDPTSFLKYCCNSSQEVTYGSLEAHLTYDHWYK